MSKPRTLTFAAATCCGILFLLFAPRPLSAQMDRALLVNADTSWRNGRWAEAVAIYRQLTVSAPASPLAPRAHIQIGVYLKYQGRWQDAITEYERAIALSPRSREAHDAKTGIAAVHYFLEDFPRALQLYREVLAETRDWDQIKYCSYMIKDTLRRMARQGTQARRTQCGPASLAKACELLGVNTTPVEMALLLPSGPEGVSMADLLNAAKIKGLDPHGVMLNLEQLRRVAKPAIAFLTPGHYVVVTGMDAHGVDYIDPALRNTPQRKAPEEFAQVWTGHTLVFGRADRKMVTAFLTEASMQRLKGRICYCCPPSGLGCDNPGAECHVPKEQCSPGIAVNMVNLNLVVRDLDFSYNGRGPAVYLRRTYNGDDPQDGPFGPSWTFNYNVSLTENPNLTVDVRREEGRIDHFVRRADGAYVSPPAIYDTLVKNADNTYSLTLRGSRLTQHFTAAGKLARISDRNGNAVALSYDVAGRLASVTDSVSRVTAFQYGANNKISSVTDPAGRRVTYEYDANGNLIRTVDMAGHAVAFTYDTARYITAMTTPRGTTRIAYTTDYEGYAVSSVTDPLGGVTSYGTYQSHYRTRLLDANNHATLFENSYDGQTDRVIDALGNATAFAYDSNGNRTRMTDATGRPVTLTYDARGNGTSIVDPLKNAVTLSYDANDNLIRTARPSSGNPAGMPYQFSYDARGNLTQILDPDGRRVSMIYDSSGQMNSLTDARGNTTSFLYDTRGNLVRLQEPLSSSTFAYDDVGRVTSMTDPKGNTIRYSYDGIDRLTMVTYPDMSTRTYTYDCCGATSITDSAGTITLEHDAVNRLARYTDVFGAVISYAYDATGNLLSLTYPGDRTVNYEYDDASRPISVADWLGNATRYAYDAAGRLLSSNTANGPIVLYRYDAAGRLTNLVNYRSDGMPVAGYVHTLDASGDTTAQSTRAPLGTVFAAGQPSYTYDAENRIVSGGGTTFGHDLNGNLTTLSDAQGTTTLEYDFDNRLVRLLGTDRDHRYTYDALGNRVAKSVNGATTRFLVDPNAEPSQVLAETDGAGSPTAYYVYGLGLISRLSPDGRSYFYYFDRLGSTVAVSDRSGVLVNAYAYEPYGIRSPSSVESVPNPFRYVGRVGVVDDANGLLYMRARYYVPVTGRFLTKDPMASLGGAKSYSYVGGSPIAFADPLGLYRPNFIDQLTKHGNWCGKHWSGRCWIEEGQLGPREVGTTDWLDEICKYHDTQLIDANKGATTRARARFFIGFVTMGGFRVSIFTPYEVTYALVAATFLGD